MEKESAKGIEEEGGTNDVGVGVLQASRLPHLRARP